MKWIWLGILTLVCIGSICNESCQWNQYLGNPGRTAYTDCSAPDSPEILWEITLDGVADTPFIVGDKVIVCSQFYSFFPPPLEPAPPSNVTVIDLLTGTLVQKIVPEVGLYSACPAGDKVLIDSGEKAYELDLSSEEISFISEIPRECFISSVFQDCYPLVLPDKIVFSTTPMVCLSRGDYSVLWDLETSLGSLYPEKAEILNIAASINQVYIIIEGESRKVLAVDIETGDSIWMNDLKVSNIAADESVVFVAGDNLYALDAQTGELLWTFETDFAMSNIAVGPTAVYITDYRNYLYAVDKETGELEWKSPWEEAEWITYIFVAGNTIICSNVLNLTAFSAKDGTELWNMHFRDYSGIAPEKPCPAVAEGILVIPKKERQKGDSFAVMRPEQLVALASDPRLFVRQGDAFLAKSLKDQAVNSYEKAAELYEKKGDLNKSQEIQEKIYELENQQETVPPTTPPETTRAPTSPPPESSIPIPISALVFAGMIGILIAYYFIKQRKS